MTTPAPHFIDLASRRWTVALNVHLAQQLRDQLELDFFKAEDGTAIAAIGADDEKLVQCLFAVCELQATKESVTPEHFAAALGGDVLEHAMQAMEQAVVLFTRPPRRAVLQAVLERVKEAKQKASEAAVAKVQGNQVDDLLAKTLQQQSQEFDRRIQAAAKSPTPNKSPTSSPPSPASTRARTR